MIKPPINRYAAPILMSVLFSTFMFFICPGPASSGPNQIISGPYSLSIHAGSYSDSATVGADARADYLNPLLNVHVYGTFDEMDASSGIGVVDNQRFGLGVALSHTYPGKANIFAGTSIINEMHQYFGHGYFGGKVKVAENAMLSASYGVGIGPRKQTDKNLTKFLTAKAENWAKAGAVVVASDAVKANLYYYIKDPGGRNISGLEGEVAYPFTEALTAGVSASSDLSTEDFVDREWHGWLTLTYSFGAHKGTIMDAALDKNNPVVYPKLIRFIGGRTATGEPLFQEPE